MKGIKLTAFSSILLASIIIFTSCEEDEETKKSFLYSKNDIPLTGAQISPGPSPSAGLGKLNVSYDKRSKVLVYSVSWGGLSDSVIAIRISGPAPLGYGSLNPLFSNYTLTSGFKPLADTTTPYIYLQQFTGGNTTSSSGVAKGFLPSSGTFSGTLLVDGFKVKEADLLSGYYYLTLHTKTVLPVAAPASFLYRWFGEVRGQITFQ